MMLTGSADRYRQIGDDLDAPRRFDDGAERDAVTRIGPARRAELHVVERIG